MLTRELLERRREGYVKGKEDALSKACAYSGAIEAIDSLLVLLDVEERTVPATPVEPDKKENDNG
jgi:hypothetical protein